MSHKPHTFAIVTALKYGWHAMWQHRSFILTVVLYTLFGALLLVVFAKGPLVARVAGQILSVIFELMFVIGVVKTTLAIVDGRLVTLRYFFLTDGREVLQVVLVTLAYIGCVIAAMIIAILPVILISAVFPSVAPFILGILTVVLLLPVIVYALRLKFSLYIVVDEHIGPLAALRKSYEMTKGLTAKLFLYTLIVTLMTAISGVVVILLMVSIPVTLLSYAYIYRSMKF